MWLLTLACIVTLSPTVQAQDVCLRLNMTGVKYFIHKRYEGTYKRASSKDDYCDGRDVTFRQQQNARFYLFKADAVGRSQAWRFDSEVCTAVPGDIATVQFYHSSDPLDVTEWLEWNQTASDFFTNTNITLTCIEFGTDTATTTPAPGDNAAVISGIIVGVCAGIGILILVVYCVVFNCCQNDTNKVSYDDNERRQNEKGMQDVYMTRQPEGEAAEGTSGGAAPVFVNVPKNQKQKKEKPRERYDVYLAYRIETGSDLASTIRMHFESKRIKTYLDDQSLQPADRDRSMEDIMAASSNFLIVLSQGALDKCQGDVQNKDAVHVAIATALRLKKRIVPIIDVKNFKWPVTANLPEDMQEVALHNGIKWVHEYEKACLKKLVNFLSIKK